MRSRVKPALRRWRLIHRAVRGVIDGILNQIAALLPLARQEVLGSIEQLEPRRLFTGTPVVLNGDGGDDAFYIRYDAPSTHVQFFHNVPDAPLGNNPTWIEPLSQLGNVTLNGGGGTDQVTVDFSGAYSPLPAGLTINEPWGSATLTIIGSAGADSLAVGATSATYVDGADGSTNLIAYPAGTIVDFVGTGGEDSVSASGGGTVVIPEDSEGNLSVDAGSGGKITFDSTQHLAALLVGAGGTVAMQPGLNRELIVGTAGGANNSGVFSVDPSGELDLGDASMLVHSDAADVAGAYTAINGLIAESYGNGMLAGEGIGSSIASQLPPTYSYTDDEGVVHHAAVFGAVTGNNYAGDLFNGTGENDIVVEYTLPGDTNLDRQVDTADLGVPGFPGEA